MVQVREAAWKRPAGWWLRHRDYLLFQLRETGGVLTAVYGVLLLALLARYHAGPDAYEAYVALLQSPPVLALTAVLFVFVMVHAITWFALIGKAQRVMSRRPKPWAVVFVGNLVIFVLASGAVLYLVFGGL